MSKSKLYMYSKWNSPECRRVNHVTAGIGGGVTSTLLLYCSLLCNTNTNTMSVQFTEPELQSTYQGVISGDADYDWAIFNQTGNELKVQATGTGLDDLEEEFMDGRWVESTAPAHMLTSGFNMHLHESRTPV